jgi:hypothetical protein
LENAFFQTIKAAIRRTTNTPITDPTITGIFDLELADDELEVGTVKSVRKETAFRFHSDRTLQKKQVDYRATGSIKMLMILDEACKMP